MTRACAPLAPFSPSISVREARDQYLAENGFTTADYAADTVTIRVFGRDVTFPNRPNRKWAIPLHDLHHAATGYGTDLRGEGEIGAFELAAGCRTPVVYGLNLAAALMGFALAPRRVFAAYRAGLSARTLYRAELPYDALLERPLAELRAHLGMPERGVATLPRKLHEAAPSCD